MTLVNQEENWKSSEETRCSLRGLEGQKTALGPNCGQKSGPEYTRGVLRGLECPQKTPVPILAKRGVESTLGVS